MPTWTPHELGAARTKGICIRLNHRLLKELAIFGIRSFAISHTLHVLCGDVKLARTRSEARVERKGSYLILVQNRVTDSGHEHHRDQNWYETTILHDSIAAMALIYQTVGRGRRGKANKEAKRIEKGKMRRRSGEVEQSGDGWTGLSLINMIKQTR